MTVSKNQFTRQEWLSLLAKSDPDRVSAAWESQPRRPDYEFLKPPETGLVMIQAKIGNTGARFNLGEMPMTRCVVRLEGGQVGFGWVAGRDVRHAELTAVFDALLQDPDSEQEIIARALTPLWKTRARKKAEELEKTSSTRVEFFTMVRGDD